MNRARWQLAAAVASLLPWLVSLGDALRFHAEARDYFASTGCLDAANDLSYAEFLLTAALMPHMLRQRTATIVTITSGLAFVPLAGFPTYCATKAALHSWTESLRYQLQGTSVEVVELPPPYVQTELTGAHQAADPRAMPLAEFVAESLRLLASTPTPAEVLVERVKPLRFAAKGDYAGFFKTFNDAMAGDRH